jgi:MFS transporter, DHA1 family, inner membrane transport protein
MLSVRIASRLGESRREVLSIDGRAPIAQAQRKSGSSIALALFMCTFAAQSSLLTLSPILPDIAADFDMSVGAVGQLRTVSGLVAGIAALRITLRPPQTSLRRLLAGGLSLLALGSLISAAAPSFPALVGAQLPIGLGLAAVLSGSLAAADRWATLEGRGRLLSWALMGQPASWIVGMPIVGFVGTVHWRFSWLAVPLAASALALAGIRKAGGREPCEPAISLRSLLRERPLVLWTLGEFLAFSAWAGTLVYVGALFVDSYGLSIGGTGLILGGVAVAYLPGNALVARWTDTSARPLAVSLALAAAVMVAFLGALRPSATISFGILAVLAFLGGGRTMASSSLGLRAGRDKKLGAMSLRATAVQSGYLVGAAVGGIAIETGGYAALGFVLGALFAAAAIPHAMKAGVT